jgi:hypothetical protein
MPSDFERELAAKIEDAMDHSVRAFTEGLQAALIGRTIEGVTGEVWSSDGEWSVEITLDDGTLLCGELCSTPEPSYLAELVRMAGGNPYGNNDSEEVSQ